MVFFYIIVVLAISLFLLCFIANKANDIQINAFGFIYYLTDIITINEIILRFRLRHSSLISYADRHTYVCRQLLTKHAPSRVRNWLFVVGATRFEHATSWSQTKRSTRLSYAPSTDLVITTYFSILQALFYFFLIFGKIKPELRKLKISFLVTIKWS